MWGAYGAIQIGDVADERDRRHSAAQRVHRESGQSRRRRPNAAGQPTGNYQPEPFYNQTGAMNWIVAPQFQLTPFRGKLSIFQKIFIDTDAYIHLGVALRGHPGARRRAAT